MPSCGAAQRSEESHGFVTARVRTLSGARGTLQLLRLAVSYAALRHLRVCVRACVREAGERAHTPPRFVSLLPYGRHVTPVPVTWYSCTSTGHDKSHWRL